MTKAEAELIVSVCVSKTRTGIGWGWVKIWVSPPMMARPPAAEREMGVEETVMMPPGVRTSVPMTKLEEGSGVKRWPTSVVIGGLEAKLLGVVTDACGGSGGRFGGSATFVDEAKAGSSKLGKAGRGLNTVAKVV